MTSTILQGSHYPFYGTDFNDDLHLSGYTEQVIYAGAGNDTIYAAYGNDVIYAGDGNDVVYGSYGDDAIYGGFGNDKLYGEEGNDYIEGNAGRNYIYGGAGSDTLVAGINYDVIYGGSGNDVIYAGYGESKIYGGDNNDALYAGNGTFALMSGGKGLDAFVIQPANHYNHFGHEIIIEDFKPGEDVINLVDFHINNFFELDLQNNDGIFLRETKLYIDYNELEYDITLKNISLWELSSDDFVLWY